MEEIVHITPLGWERDRAVAPINKMKAHRAYLIYRDDHKLITRFVRKVKDDLRTENIRVEDIKIKNAENLFEEVLFNVSRIIVTEAKKGNRIHINISASGKIDAAAATLAGMYHSDKIGSIYYVHPSSYSVEKDDSTASFEEHGLSVGIEGIQDLPYFKILSPKVQSLFILTYIYDHGPQTYESLLNSLHHARVEPFGGFKVQTDKKFFSAEEKKELHSWKMRLKRIITELSQEGYVEIKPSYKKRKKLVDLTQGGVYAAILTGEITKLR